MDYSTSEAAALFNIHPNTLRFYENVGLITPPARKENGYRIYTDLQILQCRLIRCAFRTELLEKGLRKRVVDIVKRTAAQDYPGALAAAETYRKELAAGRSEVISALIYAESLYRAPAVGGAPIPRREAARKLNVTVDVLRNWELNGLVPDRQYARGRRVYTDSDVKRLSIVKVLRLTGYSLNAILALFSALDDGREGNVAELIASEASKAELTLACDRVLLSFNDAMQSAETFAEQIQEISQTLQ